MRSRPPRVPLAVMQRVHVTMVGILSFLPLIACADSYPYQDALHARARDPLDAWLAWESGVAMQGVLDNIGPSGAKVAGAKAGIIVASPSKSDPDYFYTWTRDAALTTKCLVERLASGGPSGLEGSIQDYINSQAALQAVGNPSGGLCSGGLGEPKFGVDGTPFTGDWGRPQRDGPALRATAMMAYARYLLLRGDAARVREVIWPVVRNDLSYVGQTWNQTGFDLWEEVNSSSFFTTAAQYRALVEGSALASQMGTTCASCDSQAPQVLCLLQSYWTGSYVRANTGGGRSGKDVNSILASIHLFDPAAGCDAHTYQPCSDRALANHKQVTDSFRAIYAINRGIGAGKGVAVGRYPEDVYQGGNPWYLSAFGAAEQLYDAVYQWQRQGSITITAVSLPFFQDVYSGAATGTFAPPSSDFASIRDSVTAYADSFLSHAQQYTAPDGALAEQYSRVNGTPLSAADLTWSYAAFLTAAHARAAAMPASWGAADASVPGRCTGSSAHGPCATATATFSRPGQPSTSTRTRTRTATSTGCSATPTLTDVLFRVVATTTPGEHVSLAGSDGRLGGWDPARAVALSAQNYTATHHLWFVTVALPAGRRTWYKYIRRDAAGHTRWEADPDRAFAVPGNCAGAAAREDTWR